MFWESSSVCYQPQYFTLDAQDLDKVTLEELIDNLPNLVNDYEVGSEKLVFVLKRRDILESLIKHVTVTPPEDRDPALQFKYANQSCVLFSTKNKEMETKLIEQPDLLDKLIDFLKTDDELHPLMASFFANTLYSIYGKFTTQMIEYFNTRSDFFDLLFKHISTSAIMDFVIRILTVEPTTPGKQLIEIYEWLNNQNLAKRSIDILKTSVCQNALENTANLLTFIVQRGRQSLITEEVERKFYQFYDEVFLIELVDICFSHEPCAIHIIRLLIQFIDYDHYVKFMEIIKQKFYQYKNSEMEGVRSLYYADFPISSVSYEYLSSIKNLHKVIIQNLNKFKTMLLESIPPYSIATSFGRVEKPIGFLRLEIIHLFYALLMTNNPEMDAAFAEHKILEHLIDLFFEYEYNSFLHNHVNNIVATVFLNANINRYKLLCNDEQKNDFLKLESMDDLKNKSFMHLFNLVWSDNENYQFFKRSVQLSPDDMDKTPTDESFALPNQLSSNIYDYTPLVAKLFKDCNLLERIMNKYKSIQDDKEKNPKKILPTYKSHLIDIAKLINDYLSEYEQSNNKLPDDFYQDNFDDLYKEWVTFSANALATVNIKISDADRIVRTQRNAENEFRNFLYDEKVKPISFDPPYSAKEYEFGVGLYETQFDKEVKDKVFDPNVPNVSSSIEQEKDVSAEMTEFCHKLMEEVEKELKKNWNKLAVAGSRRSEIECAQELAEQPSGSGEQMSNVTDRDNIFQPLASSSNISNELNILMDDTLEPRFSTDSTSYTAEIKKESNIAAASFEKRSTTEQLSVGDDNQGTESKCESFEENEMIVEMQPGAENDDDEDWAEFERERASK